jgi:hypothetical protein
MRELGNNLTHEARVCQNVVASSYRPLNRPSVFHEIIFAGCIGPVRIMNFPHFPLNQRHNLPLRGKQPGQNGSIFGEPDAENPVTDYPVKRIYRADIVSRLRTLLKPELIRSNSAPNFYISDSP